MFRKIILFGFLICSSIAYGQSAQRISTALQTVPGSNYAQIIPNAQITVCSYNAQISCNSQVTIYSDVNLLDPITQPLPANPLGVYQYYIQTGTQVVEKVCGPYNQCTSNGLYIGVGEGGSAVIIAPGTTGQIAEYTGTNAIGGISPCLISQGCTDATTSQAAATNIVNGNVINPAEINGNLALIPGTVLQTLINAQEAAGNNIVDIPPGKYNINSRLQVGSTDGTAPVTLRSNGNVEFDMHVNDGGPGILLCNGSGLVSVNPAQALNLYAVGGGLQNYAGPFMIYADYDSRMDYVVTNCDQTGAKNTVFTIDGVQFDDAPVTALNAPNFPTVANVPRAAIQMSGFNQPSSIKNVVTSNTDNIGIYLTPPGEMPWLANTAEWVGATINVTVSGTTCFYEATSVTGNAETSASLPGFPSGACGTGTVTDNNVTWTGIPSIGRIASVLTLDNIVIAGRTAGLTSATYVSGGSPSGTGSVPLTTFNNCGSVTGTMNVTTDIITLTPGATGAPAGACSAAATTAVCANNGAAFCSGTITIISTLNATSNPFVVQAQAPNGLASSITCAFCNFEGVGTGTSAITGAPLALVDLLGQGSGSGGGSGVGDITFLGESHWEGHGTIPSQIALYNYGSVGVTVDDLDLSSQNGGNGTVFDLVHPLTGGSQYVGLNFKNLKNLGWSTIVQDTQAGITLSNNNTPGPCPSSCYGVWPQGNFTGTPTTIQSNSNYIGLSGNYHGNVIIPGQNGSTVTVVPGSDLLGGAGTFTNGGFTGGVANGFTSQTDSNVTASFAQGSGGVSAATYVSGGTIGATTGYVNLASFNNSCSGTTATMAVTSGTPGAITITASGTSCGASAPTTATCSNGTVTCSGTVTLTSTSWPYTQQVTLTAGVITQFSGAGIFYSTPISLTAGTQGGNTYIPVTANIVSGNVNTIFAYVKSGSTVACQAYQTITTVMTTYQIPCYPSASGSYTVQITAVALVLGQSGVVNLDGFQVTPQDGGVQYGIPYWSTPSQLNNLGPNTAATDQVPVSHGTGSGGAAPTLSNAPALAVTNMTGTGGFNTTGSAGSIIGVLQASQGGDMACAVAADTTIGSHAITGGTSTSSTLTFTTATTAPVYIGQLIDVTGYVGANNTLTAQQLPVTAFVSATSITVTTSDNPGNWSSGGTWSLACGNQSTDAIVGSLYSFASQPSLPASVFGTYPQSHTEAQFEQFSSATAPTLANFRLYYGSTGLWFNNNVPAAVSSQSVYGMLSWSTNTISYSSPNALVETGLLSGTLNTSSAGTGFVGTQAGPQSINVSSGHPLIFYAGFTATGVASGTYTSGITAVGSASQTCILTSFNNSSTATATVALTGTNTIAGGTALVITSRGYNATAAPTSATAGSGTATCSGTATIATVLGGSPGNAILLNSLTWRPY